MEFYESSVLITGLGYYPFTQNYAMLSNPSEQDPVIQIKTQWSRSIKKPQIPSQEMYASQIERTMRNPAIHQ